MYTYNQIAQHLCVCWMLVWVCITRNVSFNIQITMINWEYIFVWYVTNDIKWEIEAPFEMSIFSGWLEQPSAKASKFSKMPEYEYRLELCLCCVFMALIDISFTTKSVSVSFLCWLTLISIPGTLPISSVSNYYIVELGTLLGIFFKIPQFREQ